jgi:hypothetical protein
LGEYLSALAIIYDSTYFLWCRVGIDWKSSSEMYKYEKCTRRTRTNLELALYPVLVFQPVLLFHLLVTLNGLDEFRLDQCGLLIASNQATEVRDDATREKDATGH